MFKFNMIHKNTVIALVFCLCLLFFGTQSVVGQTINDLSFQLEPVQPKPFEDTVVRLRSFSIDLSRSNISWYLNDELTEEGVGDRDFTFRVGDLGSTNKISVVIETTEGSVFKKSTVYRPFRVNVLWEAVSYTPPFYKGKALAPQNGLIAVTAMPELMYSDGTKLDPSKLIYTWEQDGFVLGSSSGYGKQQLIVAAKRIARLKTSILVTITSFDGVLETQAGVNIPTTNPGVLFYEDHPLQGVMYDHAIIDTFELVDEEVNIRSEPYFFSLDDVFNRNIQYHWTINGLELPTPLEEQTKNITLRKAGDVRGLTNISLDISTLNIDRILQEIYGEFNISFR
jgi:hypothetical protein